MSVGVPSKSKQGVKKDTAQLMFLLKLLKSIEQLVDLHLTSMLASNYTPLFGLTFS